MKVLTQNVWFEDVISEERYTEILKNIEKIGPDIVCFQECTVQFLEILVSQDWIQNYTISDRDGKTFMGLYGVILLIKKPIQILRITRIPFPNSKMGRGLITAILLWEGKQIAIGSSHFESERGSEGIETRKAQYKICTEYLFSQGDIAVLCGDFNIGDEQKESTHLNSLGWKDACATGEPTYGIYQPGKIFDLKRLDRILYRGNIIPTDFNLLGNEPIRFIGREPIYPSDHLGVCVILNPIISAS
jgi:endonuclease/exonuclease/phosphatase family metal-dependent hydrolase